MSPARARTIADRVRRRRRIDDRCGGVCVPVSDRILAWALDCECASGVALWRALSLSERIAEVLRVGLDDVEREVRARGVRLHLPPTWDGSGGSDDLVRALLPRARCRAPRWRRAERGRLVRGVWVPPAERRRLDALVRAMRRVDPVRASSRDAALREIMSRGATCLRTKAPTPTGAIVIEPMASIIRLPHLWMRRIVGQARLAIVPRRPLRRARRRAGRRRSSRRRRLAPCRASPDDDPPDDEVVATDRRSR